MLKLQKGCLIETGYQLNDMPKNSALFTTGNGYMGIRGSNEEFGETRIQGAYIRGLFDEYTEIVQPFADNIYMKKYYFNEQALKDYERQDICINFADILTIRFAVDGKTFYPWEGEVVAWKRSLDTKTGVLTRTVDWNDGDGNITRFNYSRFSSYENQHLYVMKASAKALNHNKKIEIISGIDTKVRTGGQHISSEISHNLTKSDLSYKMLAGKKYGYEVGITMHNDFYMDGNKIDDFNSYDKDGLYGSTYTYNGGNNTISVEKLIFVNTSRDHDKEVLSYAEDGIKKYIGKNFDENFAIHYKAWKVAYDKFSIEVTGDDKANDALSYANYQTIISGDPKSHVHSFSAKALSGEQYNQFVWWDSEIYQVPVFMYTMPEVAKNDLLFRYSQLEDAKKNAEMQGYKGARYPFVSSVGGKERVWTYVRHPVYQVHITADVGYAVTNYYEITNDFDFLRDYGMEMLTEILRYWVSRMEYKNGRYEIINVTGTDEHHPYVDNDAYTNYVVHILFTRYLDYLDKFFSGKFIDDAEKAKFVEVRDNMYLPMEENGLIPQFDGYFDLSRGLQVEGGSGNSFQMKQSGLYHLSQIIKQPDVMMLYSYIDCFTDKDHYALNWDYYESMCEASSSLTAPVHAICSADNGRFLSFYNYLMKTIMVDIDDIYGCSWQGIHSGCAAGGYYCLLRGVMGVRTHEGELIINPSPVPFWKKVKMQFIYHGVTIKLTLTGKQLVVDCGKDTMTAVVMGKKKEITGKKTFKVNK